MANDLVKIVLDISQVVAVNSYTQKIGANGAYFFSYKQLIYQSNGKLNHTINAQQPLFLVPPVAKRPNV